MYLPSEIQLLLPGCFAAELKLFYWSGNLVSDSASHWSCSNGGCSHGFLLSDGATFNLTSSSVKVILHLVYGNTLSLNCAMIWKS